MENFEDFINRVLLAAALVSVIIGEIQHPMTWKGLLEGTSIAIALTIIIVVTSTNNYLAERRLAALVALSDKQTVEVFRGSETQQELDATELVVGDVVKLKMGDKVPADLLIIASKDVTCTEGDLTGEPDALEKGRVTAENSTDGLTNAVCFCKALVSTGNCTALVVAVGEDTAAGQIEMKLRGGSGGAPKEGDGEDGKEGEEAAEADDSNQTHLQKKLGTIADKIGNVGYAVALLTLAGQILRLALEFDQHLVGCGCMNITTCEPLDDRGMCEELSFSGGRMWTELLAVVIVAITVIVVAIPEGLPLAVTISLSFSSAKMRALQNLVRTLAKVEVMGGATHICSDKTGTLTQNKMTVMAVACLGQLHRVDTSGDTRDLKGNTERVKNAASQKTVGGEGSGGGSVWDALLEQITWNTDVFVDVNDGKDAKEKDAKKLSGNVTEKGLLTFFKQVIDYEGIESSQTLLKDGRRENEVAFTSSRKRASIIVTQPGKEGTDQEVRVYTKGAPDVLFDYVSHCLDERGVRVPADAMCDRADEALWDVAGFEQNLKDTNGQTGHLDTYRRTVKLFADQAYRTILVAYRDMSMAEYRQLEADHNNFAKEADRQAALECDLTAYGLFGLQDPLRPEIVGSIQQCRRSQIKVIMCTGDNIDTASAISREAGILKKGAEGQKQWAATVGAAFRAEVGTQVTDPKTKKKSDEVNVQRFRKLNLARELSVLARSSPLDKYLLVSGIQACGGVVAVTGDGTNDAPALKQADVGFAMGQTGTDVAKGACDIVLLDDNFASITVALQFGRNVYDNVRKFLQFQLTVNVVAMFIVFFGSVILKDSPLTAVQMLWVNMIMDTFAALALATEPPDEDILDRAPYHKDAPIVTDVMWRNVHGHAIYQIIVICVVIFVGQGLLCESNYDNECSEWDTESGAWELADDGMRPWCLKFNPFYSMNHYYEGATKHYWDGRVLDCEAAAAFDMPPKYNEAYGGEDTEYADGEKRDAARDKCLEAQNGLERQHDRQLWLDNPASKFGWKELAKFNCLLAEARWSGAYHATFVEGADEGVADQCHCLYDDSLDCFEDAEDDEAGYEKIRDVMGPFLDSTNTDENNEDTQDGYATAMTDDAYEERSINAWRSEFTDEGVILFPWDQARGSYTQKALHFTYVFQIFVFMQIFNQINARKLKEDERNVFSGMHKNRWFNIIMVVTFVVQMAMVEVGGEVMKVHELTLEQNAYCFLIGAGELIWGLLLKFIPPSYFECISIGDAPMTEEEKSRSFVSSLKPSMAKGQDKPGKKGKGSKGASGDDFTKPAN